MSNDISTAGAGDDVLPDDAYLSERGWNKGLKRDLAALPRRERQRIEAMKDAGQLLDQDRVRGELFGPKKRNVITGKEARDFVEGIEKNRMKLGLSKQAVDTLKNAFKKRMR